MHPVGVQVGYGSAEGGGAERDGPQPGGQAQVQDGRGHPRLRPAQQARDHRDALRQRTARPDGVQLTERPEALRRWLAHGAGADGEVRADGGEFGLGHGGLPLAGRWCADGPDPRARSRTPVGGWGWCHGGEGACGHR